MGRWRLGGGGRCVCVVDVRWIYGGGDSSQSRHYMLRSGI